MRWKLAAATFVTLGWLILDLAPATGQVFRLGAWTGTVEVAFDLRSTERTHATTPSSKNETRRSEEKVVVRNTATIYDRRVLSVNYGLNLGLLQTGFTADESQTSGNGRVRAFDLTFSALPFKPYGFTLFAFRNDEVDPVEFAGSRELQTQEIKLTFQLARKHFPGRLEFRQSDIETRSVLTDTIRGIDETRDTVTYTGNRRWRRHQLNLYYQFADVQDRINEQSDHRSQTASFDHRLEALAPNLVTLLSRVQYFDRQGELSRSSLFIDEEMQLMHTARLFSGLSFEARQLADFSGTKTTTQRASAWLNHRLYESLDSELRVLKVRSSSSLGESDLLGIRLRLDYEKRVPRGGKILANIHLRHNNKDSLTGSGEQFVREQHMARLGIPIRLEQPFVIPGSVVVTDELGTTLYEEGVDYELRTIAEFTEIIPLPGGRIQDGQAVLVDYRVEAPNEVQFTTSNQDYRLAVDFGWVMPYLGYQKSSNDVERGVSSPLFDDNKDGYAGLQFRKRSGRLKLRSVTEIRTRDSQRLAYQTLQSGTSFVYNPRRDLSLNVNLVGVRTDFSQPLRVTETIEGRLSLRWIPLPGMSIEPYASSRDVRDSIVDDQRFDRLGLEARWIFGKLALTGLVERWSRIGVEDQSGLTASFRVSRRFYPGRVAAARRRKPMEPWPFDQQGLWSGTTPSSGAPSGAASETGDNLELDSESTQDPGEFI